MLLSPPPPRATASDTAGNSKALRGITLHVTSSNAKQRRTLRRLAERHGATVVIHRRLRLLTQRAGRAGRRALQVGTGREGVEVEVGSAGTERVGSRGKKGKKNRAGSAGQTDGVGVAHDLYARAGRESRRLVVAVGKHPSVGKATRADRRVSLSQRKNAHHYRVHWYYLWAQAFGGLQGGVRRGRTSGVECISGEMEDRAGITTGDDDLCWVVVDATWIQKSIERGSPAPFATCTYSPAFLPPTPPLPRPDQEQDLLALARALPGRGALHVYPPVTATGRPFVCVRLCEEWQRAAPQLVQRVRWAYEGSPTLALDRAAVVTGARGRERRMHNREERVDWDVENMGTEVWGFYAPPATSGLHITLPERVLGRLGMHGVSSKDGGLEGGELGKREGQEVRFVVSSTRDFRHPKAGEPSQFDPSLFHARWWVIDVRLLGATSPGGSTGTEEGDREGLEDLVAATKNERLHISCACWGAAAPPWC